MTRPGGHRPPAVRGLRKAFGPTRALAGVDFDVLPGEVHTLVGENGAGKSTLVKVLSGALRADAGGIELDGTPYRPTTPLDGARRGDGLPGTVAGSTPRRRREHPPGPRTDAPRPVEPR